MAATTSRVPVAKTYKIYIGGKFPRTESGRYYTLEDSKGNVIANVCRGSRKDFRNAMVAALQRHRRHTRCHRFEHSRGDTQKYGFALID